MQLVALTGFWMGLGPAEEVIHRGDSFAAKGTGIMNAREVGQNLIRDGKACLPDDADKRLAATQASWGWADTEVARLKKQRRA